MKKIEAVIRPERLEAVLGELRRLSYPGVTVTEVRGHGKQKGVTRMWRGAVNRLEFLSKLKLEVVVLDENLAKVVKAVVQAGRTGAIGDGKVFVYEVTDAVRIRTGVSGFQAI